MDTDKWLQGPSKIRLVKRIELPQPVKCNNCGKHNTHSELVCCLDLYDMFHFQCQCGSTLAIRNIDEKFIIQVKSKF